MKPLKPDHIVEAVKANTFDLSVAEQRIAIHYLMRTYFPQMSQGLIGEYTDSCRTQVHRDFEKMKDYSLLVRASEEIYSKIGLGVLEKV